MTCWFQRDEIAGEMGEEITRLEARLPAVLLLIQNCNGVCHFEDDFNNISDI